MTSDERGTLGESDEPSERDAAGPISPGAGFAASTRGPRDAVVIVALLAALLLLARAALGPLTDALVGRIPVGVDESVGSKLADFQRATSAPIDELRTVHVRDLLNLVEPRVRRAVGSEVAVGSFRVTVLDSNEVNAFALPGGEVFVLRGLLEAKHVTDDVLVGILAHELAHAALRHGVRGIVRRNLVRTAAAVLFGGLDTGTVAIVGGGLTLGDLAYDRAMEDEADGVAARVLLASGRPLEPLAVFLESLDAMGPTVALLANHPAGADRAARLRAHEGR